VRDGSRDDGTLAVARRVGSALEQLLYRSGRRAGCDRSIINTSKIIANPSVAHVATVHADTCGLLAV